MVYYFIRVVSNYMKLIIQIKLTLYEPVYAATWSLTRTLLDKDTLLNK
jgi:hypothetical protein